MKKILFIILLANNLCFTCVHEDENSHYHITFYNNSDKDIYIIRANAYPLYPDTVHLPVSTIWEQPQCYKAVSNSINTEALWDSDPYESSFRDMNDTLMVYTFDADMLETTEMYSYDAILQRYDLSLDDLRRLNWTLVYPPNDAMKDVHMSPPYRK